MSEPAFPKRRCLRHRVRGDTSPPNGMLPVNRPFSSVSQGQRALNQQLANLQFGHGGKAFTPVNGRAHYSVQRVNALINKGFQHPDA